MRLNRKCRRTLRDERAGLSFIWRLSSGSLVRTLVALGIAGILVAGGVALFDVKGKDEPYLRTESVRLRILNPEAEGTRAVLDWAKQHSPFPDRWEPNTASALRQAMAVLEGELAVRTQYRPLLRPLPELASEPPLPELFNLTRPPLPAGVPGPTTVAPSLRGEVQVLTEVSGPLQLRWEVPSRPLREVLGAANAEEGPEEMLGTERVFLLGADPSGGIGFCRSIEHSVNNLDDPLAGWLRQQRLKPDPQARGLVWGKVRVSVRRVLEESPTGQKKEAP